MDKILIRDLEFDCIIGINPIERKAPQRVRATLELDCDIARACLSDDIRDTLDYVTLRDAILNEARQSRCFLIERLAAMIAEICLREPRVAAVKVTLDKPGALTAARSVAVSLVRSRGNLPLEASCEGARDG